MTIWGVCVCVGGGRTCKSVGSGILPALELLGVIVMEFDSDDRRLRAEEGREDDLLSETHTHTHTAEEDIKNSHR